MWVAAILNYFHQFPDHKSDYIETYFTYNECLSTLSNVYCFFKYDKTRFIDTKKGTWERKKNFSNIRCVFIIFWWSCAKWFSNFAYDSSKDVHVLRANIERSQLIMRKLNKDKNYTFVSGQRLEKLYRERKGIWRRAWERERGQRLRGWTDDRIKARRMIFERMSRGGWGMEGKWKRKEGRKQL